MKPPKTDAPGASWDTLPAELHTEIARSLCPEDLLALARASRSTQAAAAPLWRDAYGPFPCHREARTEPQWRRAVAEKAASHRHLLAPLRPAGSSAVPRAAVVAACRRLDVGWGRPLGAYVGLQSLAGGFYADPEAPQQAIGMLLKAGMRAQAVELAHRAAKHSPQAAAQVIDLGSQRCSGPVCEAALEAGAALPHARHLPLIQAAETGDLAMLRLVAKALAAHPEDPSTCPPLWRVKRQMAPPKEPRTGITAWALAQAMRVAFENDHDECVRLLASLPSAASAKIEPPLRYCDLAKRGSPEAVSRGITLLQSLGVPLLSSFSATLRSTAPGAEEAARIVHASLPPEEGVAHVSSFANRIWQAFYGPPQVGSPFQSFGSAFPTMRRCLALGARFTVSPIDMERVAKCRDVRAAAVAVAAGLDIRTPLQNFSSVQEFILTYIAPSPAAEQALSLLRDVGL